MEKKSKILVLGQGGLAGSAIIRTLEKNGYNNILRPTSKELDLTIQSAVFTYFENNQPEYVFLAAGKVGGIMANKTYPADFIYINMQIVFNTIEACRKFDIKKVLYLGSSCIYPKISPQPIKEEYLLSGDIDESNKPYAISKIAGIVMCQAYRKQYNLDAICLMPTNLFGIGDNYDQFNSHLIAALISKIHNAKSEKSEKLILWGTGKPKREILYSDHLGEACLYLMNNYSSQEIVNIGTGVDFTISQLANLVKEIVGYQGEIVFDSTFPDGVMEKRLDVSLAKKHGWEAKYDYKKELESTYKNYLTKK
jgi:GDP-L-fucose synthase